jgi:hypothetical protein
MTAVTQWHKALKGKHWAARAVPEPPRHRRVAKSAPEASDRVGRDLEEWMRDLTVARTLDAD